MLVRTMSPGERIRVTIPPSTKEQTVEVVAVAVKGSKRLRIGVEAKREITFDRVEQTAEVTP